MIKCALYNPDSESVQNGGIELLDTWQSQPKSTLWIDICKEAEADELALLRQLSFHELAIQDAMRKRHPPKVEVFDDSVFYLLRDLDDVSHGLDSEISQLSMFMRDRLLVTRHRKPSPTVDWVFDAIEADNSKAADGVAAVASRIFNRLVRRYVKLLIEFELRLDELEQEMFDRPNDSLLAELTSYKSRLRYISRNANYHKLIVSELKDDPEKYFSGALTHEIIDLYEQVERSQSLAGVYYDVLKDLSDGYLALSSHRLNRVMQILTVITVIFVPLTFLAGIYGMNFENMPELSFGPSYFVLLGVMAVAAAIQLLLFRRKGWL